MMSADGPRNPPGRLVKLVLVMPNGEVLGSLAPFPVTSPWWQDAKDVVRGALENHGLRVTLLRLLEAERPRPHGGLVTYLAEVETRVLAEPWSGRIEDHQKRQSWARPGGPSADLAWADRVLASHNMHHTGPPEQARTWNLSSIWRIPVGKETVWLKVVPPFFAHEGPLLGQIQGGPVPKLLAYEDRRMLLVQVPGDDMYDAPLPLLLIMIRSLVNIQKNWIERTDGLLKLGLPDLRLAPFAVALRHTIERNGMQLSAVDRASLATFLEGLGDRFEALHRCGIPDALVHGDFHPGNCRGDPTSLRILDWGDSCVGHPLLDEPSFLDRVPVKDRGGVQDQWHREWSKALPHSDPDSASKLLAPIAAARLAIVYQRFLEQIEPSEHPYHKADPAEWLRRTADLVRLEDHVDAV